MATKEIRGWFFPDDPCILDECRFFDKDTRQWGYAVICVREGHADRERCPGEHEMFRLVIRVDERGVRDAHGQSKKQTTAARRPRNGPGPHPQTD